MWADGTGLSRGVLCHGPTGAAYPLPGHSLHTSRQMTNTVLQQFSRVPEWPSAGSEAAAPALLLLFLRRRRHQLLLLSSSRHLHVVLPLPRDSQHNSVFCQHLVCWTCVSGQRTTPWFSIYIQGNGTRQGLVTIEERRGEGHHSARCGCLTMPATVVAAFFFLSWPGPCLLSCRKLQGEEDTGTG